MAYIHVTVPDSGKGDSEDYLKAIAVLERHGIEWGFLAPNRQIIIGRSHSEIKHNINKAIKAGVLERGEYEALTILELKRKYMN